MNTETPETDAELISGTHIYASAATPLVPAKLARKLELERNMWKSNHDNQVAIKRIISERPDLKEKAPLVEKLAADKNNAELLNVAFHMHIRKLESAIRKIEPAHPILLENKP